MNWLEHKKYNWESATETFYEDDADIYVLLYAMLKSNIPDETRHLIAGLATEGVYSIKDNKENKQEEADLMLADFEETEIFKERIEGVLEKWY